MEHSPWKNHHLSAAAAVILLLVFLTAGTIYAHIETSEGFGVEDADCSEHLSGSYRGVCWPLINDNKCARACIGESSDNGSGGCDFFQCWCFTICR
ncbi:hypothetical protein HU200_018083 [Digitaria exilis]|uniref:Knottin scorpion toxin-like domain-containing protein n=1 Tax=Digitaria exilis TaxID=1010633 RepID=A0A835F5A4_9POAL|nr:hypothetical protein HU200_018083 [Digitaria exilis]